MTDETTLEWSGIEKMKTSSPAEWAAVIQAAAMIYGPAAAMALWYHSPLPRLRAELTAQEPNLDAGDRSELFNVQPYVIEFLNEMTVTTRDARDRISTSDLHEKFESWAKQRGIAIGRSRSFFRSLSALAGWWSHGKAGLPFQQVKSNGLMYLTCIKLIAVSA